MLVKQTGYLLALLSACVAAPVHADPLFEVENGRIYLTTTPGTPVATYDLRFPDGHQWAGDEATVNDLKARAFPERLIIRKIDGREQSVRFTTTQLGRDSLSEAGAIITSRQSIGKREPKCGRVFANIRLSDQAPKGEAINVTLGALCPHARELHPAQELIVEGLDSTGRRLFATVSADPRWSIEESFSPSGQIKLEHIGRTAAPSTYVQFVAPINQQLAKLRVWEVDDKGQARVLADVPWAGVAITP